MSGLNHYLNEWGPLNGVCWSNLEMWYMVKPANTWYIRADNVLPWHFGNISLFIAGPRVKLVIQPSPPSLGPSFPQRSIHNGRRLRLEWGS